LLNLGSWIIRRRSGRSLIGRVGPLRRDAAAIGGFEDEGADNLAFVLAGGHPEGPPMLGARWAAKACSASAQVPVAASSRA